MDQAAYTLAEMPFELNEHGFVGKKGEENPYILKQSIRRRLNRIDLNWRETQPVLLYQDADTIVMTLSIVVSGVERFGVGVGIIQRASSDGKEYTGYTLARNRAKAFKTAASDALARAALELGLGWYLRLEEAKKIHNAVGLEAWLNKLKDQRAAKEMRDQLEQDEQEGPPRRPAHVDANGEVHREESATPWPSTSWYADEEARHKFGQFLDQRKISITHVAELIGRQPWEFADGRAACEAIVAKLEPAQPRNGRGGKPAAADSAAATDAGLNVEVHLAREVIVNPIYNSAFQYTAVCDKGVNIPVVGSDLYKAAGFTEAMITRWKNNKTSGPFSEPVEVHATRDTEGKWTLIQVVAPQAVLDDQQRRNAPSPNPVPTDKELEAMGDIPF